MSDRPHVLGLTGSIGMGKSTVAAMFRDEGVPVFDADGAVHALQGPGGALVNAIEAAFPGTTGADGVDRHKLGAAVLGDGDAMSRLEALIHPEVGRMRQNFLRTHENAALVVVDIPLLYEKGGQDGVDSVAVVSAPAAVQRQRVLSRPGMSAEKFAHILELQLPDAQKRARADYVIDTGTTLGQTRHAVRQLVTKLSSPLARP